MVNLRHDRIAPKAKFLVRKAVVERYNRERRVSEEFVGPIRPDSGALRPGERGTRPADAAALPFGFRVPDKPICALVENVIGNSDLADGVGSVRTIVTEDEEAVGVGGVTKRLGELGKVIAPGEQGGARAGLNNEIANTLGFVEQHQAVFVRDAGDVSADPVGGVGHGIDPIAFTEVPRIDSAITDLCSDRQGEEKAQRQ